MILSVSMRIPCLIFLFVLPWLSANAQINVIDSLENELIHHPGKDSTRINMLNTLSTQYQWINFKRSLDYADEALHIADSLSFSYGIAMACFRQAHCYWALGDSDRAIEKSLRAVSIAEQKGFGRVMADAYRVLAISYRDQQETEKALYYIRQAETLAHFEKDWDLLARIYNVAGVVDFGRGLNDSALYYYQQALNVTDSHAITKFHVSQVLSNIGEIYLESDTDLSLKYFVSALASAKETRNRSAESGILADIGRALIRKNNYNGADTCLQQSLRLSRELGLRRVTRHAYLALADLKAREGKSTEALNYMKAYYDVRDSLLNGVKTRQIVAWETRFETEKQAQKIKLLEQEKRIQLLWRNVLIIGSLLLIVALVTIYRLQQLRSAKARQLLATQQALNEKLTETDTVKSRFFANISHEFRTPLSLIIGPVEEQLRHRNLSPDERKNMTMIQRNAKRLLALVNQLLDLSKLEAGKMELIIRPGNLSEFMTLLAASFDSLADHRQLHFVKRISPSSTVGYDADKIEKIVTNMLVNAFKFTPPGGTVIFSMHVSTANQIVISVADTGKGIPAEEQSKIFTPFYRLKHDGEGGVPGTGLGLSMVNELVQFYGGHISLTSELDAGTCIVVTIPLFDAEGSTSHHVTAEKISPENVLLQEDEENEAGVITIGTEAMQTILIVEDSTELRHFIASGFRERFTVFSAKDGEAGLAMAMKYIPDVIISDVMMPRLNGVEFTNAIKQDERTSHIPVVLLTAKVDRESRMDGLRTGADDYLAKPFSMEELQVRVRNLMDQRKRLAEKLKEKFLFQREASPKVPSLDEKFIGKVRSVVEANISNNLFSVEQLATEMNLSRAQLFRKLKALLNTSPSEFINDLRLQRAAQLIRARADNVAQIGYAVGFNEQSYFAKRFRKKYGVSPSEYSS